MNLDPVSAASASQRSPNAHIAVRLPPGSDKACLSVKLDSALAFASAKYGNEITENILNPASAMRLYAFAQVLEIISRLPPEELQNLPTQQTLTATINCLAELSLNEENRFGVIGYGYPMCFGRLTGSITEKLELTCTIMQVLAVDAVETAEFIQTFWNFCGNLDTLSAQTTASIDSYLKAYPDTTGAGVLTLLAISNDFELTPERFAVLRNIDEIYSNCAHAIELAKLVVAPLLRSRLNESSDEGAPYLIETVRLAAAFDSKMFAIDFKEFERAINSGSRLRLENIPEALSFACEFPQYTNALLQPYSLFFLAGVMNRDLGEQAKVYPFLRSVIEDLNINEVTDYLGFEISRALTNHSKLEELAPRRLLTSKYLSDDSHSELRRESARIILAPLFAYAISSALDVGCRHGEWCEVLSQHGVADITGIDHVRRVDRSKLFPDMKFLPYNLSLPHAIRFPQKFDLAICLDPAEHIQTAREAELVALLCASADIVVFSGAVRGQAGQARVKERSLEFWKEKFQERKFALLDPFRAKLLGDPRVPSYYAKNVVLFVRKSVVEKLNEDFASSEVTGIPTVYSESRVEKARQISQLGRILKFWRWFS